MVRQISAQMTKPLRAAQAFGPPPVMGNGAAEEISAAAQQQGVMNIEQIMQLLPHRYPMLMLDRVVKVEAMRITAIKNVSANEPYFQGHFPGHPIMPGVFQLEAMAQAAGLLMIKHAEQGRHLAYFMSAENVKWRKPVEPGDVLTIEVELMKTRGKIGKARGVCKVRGEIVSEAEVTFMLRAEPE
jgi:UDP-3-O-[3-hydroxymyristoyl] N-acetylglucosamine deacetylase/3-hydroxyacyl-[acyl-carrier-protein] dehydratase